MIIELKRFSVKVKAGELLLSQMNKYRQAAKKVLADNYPNDELISSSSGRL